MEGDKDRIERHFLESYERYVDAIYRHCYFRVFSAARSEEIVQEVFLKTWEYLKNGKTIENMKAFLYRVATNAIIDDKRKVKERSLDALLEEAPSWEPEDVRSANVEERAMLVQMTDAMHRLPDDVRALLVMRYVDDMDPREIAVVLGISANAVSVRLTRAVGQLRKIVA